MDSPALSVTTDFSDFTDEELDRYFANYVPLSNLPTPPPAKEQPAVRVPDQCPASATEVCGRTPELEVYATHLSNLVPLNVSTQQPSVPVIQSFLERANLPTETVAFAACILDALSQRFASSWRDACTSNGSAFSFSKLKQSPGVGPEVIILSAFALAHGFIDDRGRSNTHWAKTEGNSRFAAKEIEATKLCILKDIDYGLVRITEAMVQRMLRDMTRSGAFTTSTCSLAHKDSVAEEKEERRPRLSLDMQGTAVWVNGVQTPEPSP